MDEYIVSFKVIDSTHFDGTVLGVEREYEKAKTIFLRHVTDIDAAVEEYSEKLPFTQYVDDVRWRKEAA